ncbi:MAG: hypothetical protein QOK05_1333 [Chloroflexota bacterium]|jgi:amino acid transporter|nr:hypothetical protein [Chloroflexota bacterium]
MTTVEDHAAQAALPSHTLAPDVDDYLREAGIRWAAQTAPGLHPLRVEPELELYEEDEDTGGGLGVMRFARAPEALLARQGEGWLRATVRAERPAEGVGRVIADIRSVLLGAPLATARLAEERLSKVMALGVLASNPLSSVAYATEQTLAVLFLAGAGALSISQPIGIIIVAVMAAVGLSYRQTIRAYPRGGGSYIVAKDNLGPLAGLTAAAALLTDYILTVAVSVSAGLGALVSAFTNLQPYLVPIGLAIIGLMALANLRGLREAGSVFAIPTYLFLAGLAALLLMGFYHLFSQGAATPFAKQTNYPGPIPLESLGLLLLLKAFSSGCTALTGVEAISDGVMAFKEPEWRNARKTLSIMTVLMAVGFLGINYLAFKFQLYPDFIPGPGLPGPLSDPHLHMSAPYQTILSKLSHVAFGGGAMYFYLQATTAVILVLAANTAFSDFPRVLYFVARDRYAPGQFTILGDRLAFSNGIIALALAAAFVFWFFRGSTDALIPLYTVGVFLSFTLSQLGMVARWRRLSRSNDAEASRGWRRNMAVNLFGAIMTALVLVVATVGKFRDGAWIIIVLIIGLIMLALAIHRHYSQAGARVHAETPVTPGEVKPLAIVPISDLTDVQLQTLALARRLSDEALAVFISDDQERIREIRAKWDAWGNQVPLEIIESPYRSIVRPLLNFLDAVEAQRGGDTLMVILPELVYTRWWHQFLHNQTALRLKAALLFRPGTVVMSVPYHLRDKHDDREKRMSSS